MLPTQPVQTLDYMPRAVAQHRAAFILESLEREIINSTVTRVGQVGPEPIERIVQVTAGNATGLGIGTRHAADELVGAGDDAGWLVS